MGITVMRPRNHCRFGNCNSSSCSIFCGNNNTVRCCSFIKCGRSVNISNLCRSGCVIFPGDSFAMKRSVNCNTHRRFGRVDCQCSRFGFDIAGAVSYFYIDNNIVAVICGSIYDNIGVVFVFNSFAIFVGIKSFALGFFATIRDPILYRSNTGIVALIFGRNSNGHIGIIIAVCIRSCRSYCGTGGININHNIQRIVFVNDRDIMPAFHPVTVGLVIKAYFTNSGCFGNCNRGFVPSATNQFSLCVVYFNAIFARCKSYGSVLCKHIKCSVQIGSQCITGIERNISHAGGAGLLKNNYNMLIFDDTVDLKIGGSIIRSNNFGIYTVNLNGLNSIASVRHQSDLCRTIVIYKVRFDAYGTILSILDGHIISIGSEGNNNCIVLICGEFFDILIVCTIVCTSDRCINNTVDFDLRNTVVVIRICGNLNGATLNNSYGAAHGSRISHNSTVFVVSNSNGIDLGKGNSNFNIGSNRDFFAESSIVFNHLSSSSDCNRRDLIPLGSSNTNSNLGVFIYNKRINSRTIQGDRTTFNGGGRDSKFLHYGRGDCNIGIDSNCVFVCLALDNRNILAANSQCFDIGTGGRRDLYGYLCAGVHRCHILFNTVYLYGCISGNRNRD